MKAYHNDERQVINRPTKNIYQKLFYNMKSSLLVRCTCCIAATNYVFISAKCVVELMQKKQILSLAKKKLVTSDYWTLYMLSGYPITLYSTAS